MNPTVEFSKDEREIIQAVYINQHPTQKGFFLLSFDSKVKRPMSELNFFQSSGSDEIKFIFVFENEEVEWVKVQLPQLEAGDSYNSSTINERYGASLLIYPNSFIEAFEEI